MKNNTFICIIAGLFFFMMPLPSSAEDISSASSEASIVIHDHYVEGFKMDFKVPREGLEGEMNVDAPVQDFDGSKFGDRLSVIPWRDAFGYPPLKNAFHDGVQGGGRMEGESGGTVKWTPQDGEVKPPDFVDPILECKPTPTSQGYFIAYFEEVELANGEGYDHPVNGAARRNEVCKVLKDIAQMINMGTSKPQIAFYKDPGNIPSNALAFASTYYSNNQGFSGGALWQNITSGNDPIPGAGNFDGYVVTNFYGGAAWDVDVPAQALMYDLYSVIYHEIMHALGFASRIPPVITQEHVDGTASQGYSNFDKFLFAAKDSTLALINPVAPNQYTGTVGAPSPELISNQDVFSDFDFPVYSPESWESGSSMSHFDEIRGNTSYIMHPSIGPNTSKIIHAHEKSALCQIGYSINGFDCGNQSPIAVDDVDLTLNQVDVGHKICINFKANDFDPDGDAFYLASMDVILGGNPASLTYWNADQTAQLPMTDLQTAVVCYTPASNFQGIALLQYTLSDGNGEGNTASIKIDVTSDLCIDDPTNYVCNGEFEQGASPNGILTLGGPNVPFWHSVTNSPDVLRREYTAAVPFLSWFWKGPNSYSGAPNDRYITGFVEPTYGEAAYTILVKPLDPAKNYVLSFYYHRGVLNYSDITLSPEVYLSENQPTYSNDVDYEPTGTDQTLYSTTEALPLGWQHHSVAFSPASGDHKYLIIKSKWLIGDEFGRPFYGYDAVAIRDEGVSGSGGPGTVDVRIDKGVDQPSPVAGEAVHYTIRVKNLGTGTATDIHVADHLPAGVTHVEHSPTGFTNGLNAHVVSDQYVNGIVSWTIDKLTSNEWIDLTVTVQTDASDQCQAFRNVAIMTSVTQDDVSPLNHYIDPSAPGFPFTVEAENYSGKKDINVQCSGAVSGRVFNDLNQNGLQDSGESGVASIQAELYKEANGQPVIPAVAAAFSSADPLNYGSYQFDNIAPGTYYVKLNNPLPWFKMSPLPGVVSINGDNRLHKVIINGDAHPNKDFGIKQIFDTDIIVNKRVRTSSTPIEIGDPVTYDIQVYNAGPVNATNVQILDKLPSGVNFQSSTSSPGVTYNPSTGIIHIPSLNVGQSVGIQMMAVVNVHACGKTITNTAQFQSMDGGQDINPANGISSASFTVPACLNYDLKMKKTLDSVTFQNGSQILTYKVTVKNIGMNAVYNIKAKDQMPVNAKYISHTWTGPGTVTYETAAKTLWAVIPALTPGQKTYITLRVLRTSANPVVNTAVITGMNPADQNPANNSATQTYN